MRKSVHHHEGVYPTRRYKALNIYTPKVEALVYINQFIRNIKKLIDNNTRIIENFNTPLTEMDTSPNPTLIRKQWLRKAPGTKWT